MSPRSRLLLAAIAAILGVVAIACSPQTEAPSGEGDGGLKPGSQPTEAQKNAMRSAHMRPGSTGSGGH